MRYLMSSMMSLKLSEVKIVQMMDYYMMLVNNIYKDILLARLIQKWIWVLLNLKMMKKTMKMKKLSPIIVLSSNNKF